MVLRGIIDRFRPAATAPEAPPPLPVSEEDRQRLDFREEILQFRKGRATYPEWLLSDYVADMWRRKEYYDGRQVVVREDNFARPIETPMTPEEWSAKHSGPGWEDLKAMLPDATAESVVKFFGLPLTSVVIDNRQVVYTLPVRSRQVVKDGQIQKELSVKYTDILEAAEHDLQAEQLCKWTGLFGTAFQITTFDSTYNRLERRNLEPWRVQVLHPTGAKADLQAPETMVCVNMTDEDLTKRYRDDEDLSVWQVWWRDQWWYEVTPGVTFKDIECTIEGTNPNPYRDRKTGQPVKPIISVKDVITTEAYALTSDMLIRQNQVIDRQLTANNYMLEYQGFAVPVATGVEPEELIANPYSAGAPMSFRSPEADFKFANPNARPTEFSAAIRSNNKMVARIYAVDGELVDSETKVASGVAKAQARLALAERRDQQMPKWQKVEREWYWLSAIVWNYWVPEEHWLDEIDRFLSVLNENKYRVAVEFAPLDPSADPLADSLTNKNNLDMDLITKVELIASQRKITIEQAAEIYKTIKKENEKERNARLLPVDKLPVDRIGRSGARPQNLDAMPSETAGTGTTMGQGNGTSSTDDEESQTR